MVINHKARVHTCASEKTKFNCRVCNISFDNGDSFSGHNKDSHGIEHKCKTCDKIFNTKYRLEQHILTVHEKKRFKCDQCPRKYARPSLLKYHKKVVHSEEVICELCHKASKNKLALLMHKRTYHGTKSLQYRVYLMHIRNKHI